MSPADAMRWFHRATLDRGGRAFLRARAIRELLRGAHVGDTRAQELVEPLERDAPVAVLVGTHVMIVVPRQVRATPLGIDVAATVIAAVLREQVPRGRR